MLSEELIESIKSRSLAPISQSTFSDTKLLTMANEELQLKLVSDIISVREDFFLATKENIIIGDIDHYSVPKRAIGDSLKDVFFKDNQGNLEVLKRVEPRRKQDFMGYIGTPGEYYFEGSDVVILPKPTTSTGYVHFLFPAKPGNLIATSSCAKITSISSTVSTVTFTVNTDLTASLSVGDKLDFISSDSPYKLYSYDLEITQITSTTIEVARSGIVNVNDVILPQVNDYICPAGYSNIPQVPEVFHPVLAQMVVVRLMESLGDLNKLGAAQKTLGNMRSEALKLIKNRVEGSPQKVSSRSKLVRMFR